MPKRPGVERRRYPRVTTPDMNAVVLARAHSSVCPITNLSTGGARFLSKLPLACGESVNITFEIDRIPITVTGMVVRVDEDAFAISFLEMSTAMHHFIQRLVLEMLKRASRPPEPTD